ncbi:Holliday junction branch migration DNA helicase RuvB [Ignavibacteria bacterium CHB1]|mgnify:CR=1 FL=1|nr:MAG: Holliday junction branch migration DNA helicase RuvB [Chlorobiota bacterium]MBV6399704.1 Holliday junction ATP-dependent DNA helicase RuvB [Ignavibacteria bacterium]MCC6885220.1 Holliday junction branch migration DNA helicase RuvB [Ignavibacteriales bacterium]MCE7953377.1 Holliday junction branch migration DNA helicase RuvB [Chlorobi bacterium CHB7]MDL1887207.1 Holliday junction branch migration DNA helicase RuvB [Ignavibacteria bacterium CHB1]RIK47743.1 MAG: Holliday junction branch m
MKTRGSANSSELLPEDKTDFTSRIRPKRFDDFTGQNKTKENLKIFIESAKVLGESLDHILFTGPPGLGKTTLANIIANELETQIISTSGPVIEKPGDLAGMLTKLRQHEILFIDEIHRIPKVVEEFLYSAMEEYKLDIMIDQGPAARSIPLKLEKFTLIGATTRQGLLSSPMLDRFGITCHLDYYKIEDLTQIVNRSAEILQIEISKSGSIEIAKRSRATPRIANRLLRRTRDFAIVKGRGKIDKDIAVYALESLGVDEFGLDNIDKKILETIILKHDGGPVGLSTIAASISEDPGTVEEVYEPFLLIEGFIKRTPKGREATQLAYKHLGITKKQNKEQHRLFND